MPPLTSTGGMTFTGGMLIENESPATPFILAYQTTAANQQINLPLKGTVSVTVDWGDGTSNTFTSAGYANKTYATANTYIVSISGIVTGFGLSNAGAVANASRLRRVDSWGTVQLADLSGAFNGATALANVPNTLPSTVINLFQTFDTCTTINDANIANWNTSKVSNMSTCFEDAINFNVNIGGWNVSNVTDMSRMFSNSSTSGTMAFNANIASWNTSKVTTMANMFLRSTSFNQPIGNWNLANVTTINGMFAGNTGARTVFNQPIGNWNTSKITNADNFANNNQQINQDITAWCVSNISTIPTGFCETQFNLANRPLWGTCPNSYTPQAITFVGSSSNAGTSVTIPAHVANDTIVIFAYRGNANANISVGTGFTQVSRGNATSGDWIGSYNGIGAYAVGFRQASNNATVSNTWTNATNMICLVYRNADSVDTLPSSTTTMLGVNPALGNSSSNVITYPINQYWYDQSWLVAFGGHRSTDGNVQIVPTGLTYRANVTATGIGQAVAFDSNAMYGKWPNTNVTIGGTANSWIAATIRLVGKPV